MPVVVHVPHSATHVPADVRADIELDDAALADELRRLTDHGTDRFTLGAPSLGATVLVNRCSRLVVDPERFLDPEAEEMEAVGMGAVYTATSDGSVLRRLSVAQRATLLSRFFVPYHAALTGLVTDQLDRWGRCAIVDVHSYPSEALPYERHGDRDRPELCVGTDPVHTPTWLREVVVDVAAAHGLGRGFDGPFTGTFVPTLHLGDARVVSVMLEIRRDTYLDEVTATPHAGEQRIRALCTAVVAALAERVW